MVYELQVHFSSKIDEVPDIDQEIYVYSKILSQNLNALQILIRLRKNCDKLCGIMTNHSICFWIG
jgi:hypothetical protein